MRRAPVNSPGDGIAWVPVAPLRLRLLPASALTFRRVAGPLPVSCSQTRPEPPAADRAWSLPGLWHRDDLSLSSRAGAAASAQNAWVTFGEHRWVSFGERRRWAPLLFEDEQLAELRRQRDPILPATGSPSAQEKKLTRQTADGFQVNSFDTLMAALASRARVTYGLKSEESTPSFQQVPEPTPLQAKAYALLALLPVAGN